MNNELVKSGLDSLIDESPKNVPTCYSKFVTKYNDGTVLVSQNVWFVPNVTINCVPPYIKGKQDSCWVTYAKGRKPKNKIEWEKMIGMSVICFL